LGRVLAGSVTLDAVAAASPSGTDKVTLFSKGYEKAFEVTISRLEKVKTEAGTTEALIRGVAAGFQQRGFRQGGFNAYIDSRVLPGSGLSSSAVIEITLGNIINGLFNSGSASPLEIASIGQYAENQYMGKPSGLMDQVACSCGGIVTIDFADPADPKVEQVAFDLAGHDYSLLVVDTRGHHADLIPEYASIPEEMGAVSRFFGKEQLREVSAAAFYSSLADIRRTCGDRAVLRAHHFIRENQRVADQVEALKDDDFSSFLSMVNASGSSSWKYLQNISSGGSSREQEVALALALTEDFISRTGEGACRVHGGGFAGTILVFLPGEAVSVYIKEMEHLFGEGAVTPLGFRSRGGEMIPLLSG